MRNWTGHIIVIPDQHNLLITGPWKKERPDMWWWKCNNCTESSGVMSIIQLEKLEAKGMIGLPEPHTERACAWPDGENLSEYSRHPRESQMLDEDEYYGHVFYG